jgi:hypothetical protein
MGKPCSLLMLMRWRAIASRPRRASLSWAAYALFNRRTSLLIPFIPFIIEEKAVLPAPSLTS